MRPLSIRLAEPSDVAFLAASNRAMALETERKALDPETTRRGAAAVVADSAKGFYLLARRGDEAVGQLLVTYEWSDWRDGIYWWIQSVFVVPAARRTGVYRALYQRLVGDARHAARVCGVRLYADRGNTGAHATYEAMGMKRAHYEMFELDLREP